MGIHFVKLDSRVLHGVCTQLGLTRETSRAFTKEPALSQHWNWWFNTGKLANKGLQLEKTVEPDGLVEEMAEVSMKRHNHAKQLVVLFGAAGIGTGGGWGAAASRVQGLMWCPVVAPRKPPQAPRSSQTATQPAASEPGPSTPPPAKRSKCTKAEQAAEPTQPTKGKGKGKSKGKGKGKGC
ncbi:hypothetical protein QJQ45_013494 [Haematococcus lacustris]|nr:hypothetical protein QJQ45_013494 [Haematococcus lacustris]